MRSNILLVILLAVLMFGMSGCAATQTELRITVADIPDELLKCIPDRFKGRKFVKLNMKQAGLLLAYYKTAHADCESKLDQVRKLYYGWKAEASKVR